LLLLGGEVGQVRRDNIVVQPEPETGAAGAHDFLDEDALEAEVAGLPAAAVLLGYVHAEQPGLARFPPHLSIDYAVALPLIGKRHRLAPEKRRGESTELFVYGFVEVLLHGDQVWQAGPRATSLGKSTLPAALRRPAGPDARRPRARPRPR